MVVETRQSPGHLGLSRQHDHGIQTPVLRNGRGDEHLSCRLLDHLIGALAQDLERRLDV